MSDDNVILVDNSSNVLVANTPEKYYNVKLEYSNEQLTNASTGLTYEFVTDKAV